MSLTVSWQMSLSYRNQNTDLQSNSMNWFLYDRDLRHERFNFLHIIFKSFYVNPFSPEKIEKFSFWDTKILENHKFKVYINVLGIRKLIQYFFKKGTANIPFTLTVFVILLFKGRPVLGSTHPVLCSLNACNLIKKRLQHRCCSVKFMKVLSTPFFT